MEAGLGAGAGADWAVAVAAGIAAVGILCNAGEFVQARRDVLDGFFDARIVRSRYYILINRPLRGLLFDLLSSRRVFLAAVILHAAAAAAFPFAVLASRPLAGALAALVLGVHCLSNVRLCVGRDGADQMQNIVWAALACYCLPITEAGRLACLAFVPLQLILSYETAGIAKAMSPVWRAGAAVHLITRMETYCPPGMAALCGNRVVSFASSWLTILFEIGSPFLLFFGKHGALAFIASAAMFHVAIALAMGLTAFVFAFGAALPIVYHLSEVCFSR